MLPQYNQCHQYKIIDIWDIDLYGTHIEGKELWNVLIHLPLLDGTIPLTGMNGTVFGASSSSFSLYCYIL